ncbi:alpha/beta-hydrolase [Dothidotthia symphoricarpi CBS 119687]|uniref:Alpha/beta-hydrolase n=1 Tax=Dothidotthia symphoricarpi CBS 119687 TaxID=1392245 RepID=A0A6A6AD07_9PLEO|nr:alpha/beta-hydrolase [Dothidotthia symphoricarpi CBS 119687]KAF2128864.1 alpha/beta-hydrolase [Dothidotthia symphoricarpi CBS 119687]
MKMHGKVIATALLAGIAVAEPIPRAVKAPSVDLGYSIYEGSYDVNNSINVFKGIRYAAPPLGKFRFAAPQAPAKNRTSALPAISNPPICPQTGASILTPVEYGFTSALGNEDCLFLNVYAPANAKNLPVWFWIHGGGYGLFSATGLDPTEFMVTNNNTFISVIIQYRLGAFGFLSSEDVKKNGTLNAGLLDMNFALKWVQTNIGKFGGDANKVTMAGESAGAGAVLYQGMAYGGKQKENLFQNIIAASPYLTEQYDYNDKKPTKAYNDFVSAAGCASAKDKLNCLRSADSPVLQNASAKVSEAGPFGTFAFLPVTDGTFVQQRPSQGLSSKSLKGKRILSTNMANEGVPLSPPYTRNLADFRAYVNTTFPKFNSTDRAALEKQYSYAGDTSDVNPAAPRFATTGTSPPTAKNQSVFGTGQQQRVFNVFAESSFDCPSYWAASAWPQAWHYQFSAGPSYHGYDLQALWSGTATPGASFKHAFRKIWGNFITTNSPVISVQDAKGGVANSTVPSAGYDGKLQWPQWDSKKPVLLNLNATGGVPTFLNVTQYLQYNVYSDPGMSNLISIADAAAWEGGRGKRCEFWKGVADKVPY